MMSYNLSSIQQQLDSIQKQYNQLVNQNVSQNNLLTPQPPPVSRQVQYVEGMSGARLFQQNMPANCSEIILDRNEDILYFVSKDANGTPARKIPHARFQLEEDVEEEEPTFLTKKDLDSFKEELIDLIKSQKTSGGNSK